MVECTLHMHVFHSDCTEFRDEISFKEGRMKDPRKFQLLEKGQNGHFGKYLKFF